MDILAKTAEPLAVRLYECPTPKRNATLPQCMGRLAQTIRLIPAYAPYNASKVGSFPSPSSLYGWLSKLRSLFGHPKYQVPYHNRDPKRHHNFDNHPYKA